MKDATQRQPAPPARGSTRVWRVDLRQPDAEVARCRSILAPDELARAERFHFDRDRRRFVVARARLRETLGACCGIAPQDARFGCGDGGKPFLFDGVSPSRWKFNLSHAGDLALIAVTWECEIGVDVERVDDRAEALALSERFFAPAEQAWLMAQPADERQTAFFRLWTCKEAVLKALGSGLRAPLDAFAVQPQPDGTASLTALSDGFGGPDGDRWRVRLLDPAPGYAGALAAPCALARVEIADG
jgi:4'-phosphopantetheinyl transferase